MKKLPFAALLGAVFLSGAVNATDLPYLAVYEMPVANARSPQVLLEAFASKAIVAILIEVVDQRTSRRDAGHRATGHDGVLQCLVDCLPKGVGEWGEWHLREVSAAEPASQRQPYRA